MKKERVADAPLSAQWIHIFLIEFFLCKAEEPPQGMVLQEDKEEEKDENDIQKLLS